MVTFKITSCPNAAQQTASIYNHEQYAEALIQQYSQHLKGTYHPQYSSGQVLYEHGSRKFALSGLFLLDCVPNELIYHGNGSSCVEEENRAVLIFNGKLRDLVDLSNEEFSDAKFTYVNSAVISSNCPLVAGLRSIEKSGCCQVRADGMHDPSKLPCTEGNLNIFFDSFHPTEATNHLLVIFAYKSVLPIFTYPMDISHLVQL